MIYRIFLLWLCCSLLLACTEQAPQQESNSVSVSESESAKANQLFDDIFEQGKKRDRR